MRTLTYIPTHSEMLFDRAKEAQNRNDGITTAILSAASIEAFYFDLFEWNKNLINHY